MDLGNFEVYHWLVLVSILVLLYVASKLHMNAQGSFFKPAGGLVPGKPIIESYDLGDIFPDTPLKDLGYIKSDLPASLQNVLNAALGRAPKTVAIYAPQTQDAITFFIKAYDENIQIIEVGHKADLMIISSEDANKATLNTIRGCAQGVSPKGTVVFHGYYGPTKNHKFFTAVNELLADKLHPDLALYRYLNTSVVVGFKNK